MINSIPFDFYTSLFYAFVIFVLISLYFNHRHFQYWKNRNIPGPKPLPFIGNTYQLFSNGLAKTDKELIAQYGDLVGIFDCGTPILIANDADVANEVTIRKFHLFVDRRDFNGDKIFINGLVGNNGIKWKRLRRIMSPIFSSAKIRAMTSLMENPFNQMVEALHQRLDRHEHEVAIRPTVCRTTIQIIVSTAFGMELLEKNETDLAVHHAIKAVHIDPSRMFVGITFPMFLKKWMNFCVLNIESVTYFGKMCEFMMNKRRENPNAKRDYVDFVDLMIQASDEENHDRFTDLEVIANCVLILIAGFETTSLLISILLFTLAHHSEVQEKLRAEIKKLGCKSVEDFENCETQFVYMDAVIKEALRLNPPLTRTERVASEDVTLDNGLKLDAGTVIAFPIHSIHENEKYWKDPAKFDPERFLGDNKYQNNTYSFMPFHLGPRNCIGERFAWKEIKLALIKILNNFRLGPSEKTTYPLDKTRSSFVIQTDDNIYVRMTKV